MGLDIDCIIVCRGSIKYFRAWWQQMTINHQRLENLPLQIYYNVAEAGNGVALFVDEAALQIY